MALRVAVIAHRGKTLGGGLGELREQISKFDVKDLSWYEVDKSAKAFKRARRVVKDRAELIFVWGGDGMVQRCADALAGSGIPIAIVPAGTANLFATNLGIPQDIAQAVHIGFHGRRRKVDLGRVNGEHFAVMSGAGFDAEMIEASDGGLKKRLGPLAYVWSSLWQVSRQPVGATIRLDGTTWFDGDASCVLLGNIGTMTGGLQAFPDASMDDAELDVGVATADGVLEWTRTLTRMAMGNPEKSPFVRMAKAKRVNVKFARPVLYELDGGARKPVTRLKIRVAPAALTVCVPDAGEQ